MNNRAIREIWNIDNEAEKNEYILDLSDSIQEYIKSGIKNDVLGNFQQYAPEIRRELTKSINEHAKLIADLMDKKTTKSISRKIDKNTKKIIYLSHLNMLAELYVKEMECHEAQAKYAKVTHAFPKLREIAKEVDAKRRINGNELRERLKLSDNEYTAIKVNYKSYFNFHFGYNNEMGQISLSPEGRRYLKCINDAEHLYPQSQVDALVAKNCEVIISTIPTSLHNVKPQQLPFYGITPHTERTIQFSFNQMLSATRLAMQVYQNYPVRKVNAFESFRKESYNGIGKDCPIRILQYK